MTRYESWARMPNEVAKQVKYQITFLGLNKGKLSNLGFGFKSDGKVVSEIIDYNDLSEEFLAKAAKEQPYYNVVLPLHGSNFSKRQAYYSTISDQLKVGGVGVRTRKSHARRIGINVHQRISHSPRRGDSDEL